MKKIVILASGEGSRLMPLTKHVPKVLVNLGQETLLKKIYDSYTGISRDEFILVINSKYNSLVDEYIKQFNLKMTVLNVDESFGTAYTLSRISDSINNCNVLLNWCDVIPEFDNFSWDNDIIYTHGNESRYKFENNKITKEPGNIVGVYQIKNMNVPEFNNKNESNAYFKGKDFINFIYDFSGVDLFNQSELVSLTDVGELDKFKKLIDSGTKSRYFNEVEILNDSVIKRTKNVDLQLREVQWYNTVTSDNVPDVVNFTPGELVLERIHGTELYKCFEPSDVQALLNQLNFGTHREDGDLLRDLQIEVIDKSISRKNEIQGYLDYLDQYNIDFINLVQFDDIVSIKGVKGVNLYDLLEKAKGEVYKHFKDTKYTVIHGDPNFSNTLKTDSGFKFIDPRGYFGKSHLLGPRFYDEAKVLYALSGYDKFNHDDLWSGLEINNSMISIDIDQLIDVESLSQFNKGHFILLGIIWMNLGGYFKNNPTKAMAAFYYGLGLLVKYL